MQKTKIIFVILPKVHLLDLAGADQVFLEATYYGSNIEVEYCSNVKKIETTSQLNFFNLKSYKEVKVAQNDYIIVPGLDIYYIFSNEFDENNEILAWLNEMYKKQVNVCSICTGAFILGNAGLLNSKKCTTHWKHTEKLKTRFPLAIVQENILFIEDKNIVTSAGVSAGIDLALHIVSNLMGEKISFQIARELVIYLRRNGSQEQNTIYLQYRNHINNGIHKVQDWLQDNIHKSHNINDLADIACMSTRNFTRVFKKETGISSNEYTTLIRKEKITTMIQKLEFTRSEIAKHCGLKSERQVFRLMNN